MNRRSCLVVLSSIIIADSVLAKEKNATVVTAKPDSTKTRARTPALIQQKKCIHCGTCFKNCPVKAIGKEVIKGVNTYTVDPAKCVSCGTCIKNCPAKAIAWSGATTTAKDTATAKGAGTK